MSDDGMTRLVHGELNGRSHSCYHWTWAPHRMKDLFFRLGWRRWWWDINSSSAVLRAVHNRRAQESWCKTRFNAFHLSHYSQYSDQGQPRRPISITLAWTTEFLSGNQSRVGALTRSSFVINYSSTCTPLVSLISKWMWSDPHIISRYSPWPVRWILCVTNRPSVVSCKEVG